MVEEDDMICYKCVICAEVFARTNMTALHCGHVFHAECIQMWFEHTNTPTCPSCGTSINKDQIVRRLFFNATDELDDTTPFDELMEKVDALEAEKNNLSRQLDKAKNLHRKIILRINADLRTLKRKRRQDFIEKQLRISKGKEEDDLEPLVKNVGRVLEVLDKSIEMLIETFESQLKNLKMKETDSGTS